VRSIPIALSLALFLHGAPITLYKDRATGALYTEPGPGRIPVGRFIGVDEVEELVEQEVERRLGKQVVQQVERELGIKSSITLLNPDSPTFPLGRETHPNLKIRPFDDPDTYLKVGVRLQGTFERYKEIDYDQGEKADFLDGYLRRVRLEIGAGFGKHTSFTMDLRNDKSNYRDKGEQKLQVGDAYLKIKKPFGTSLVNFKFYRAKIDVSRTETVKSAWVIHYDRPHVADMAAQYISHNRRATNAQIYGDYRKKIHYQLAIGDGVHSGKFYDAAGHHFEGDFTQKRFFYGGKIWLSPFDGWEERKRTETYFAQGKHLEVGAAYWVSPQIHYNGYTIDHKLLNLEASMHYYGLFLQGEYFKFDGVVQDFFQAPDVQGESYGWYLTGEYCMPELAYLAPFFRYERWNRFKGASGYTLTSKIFGFNWYLRGNSTKVGFAIQRDRYGEAIGNQRISRYKLTTQWFF